MKSFSKTALLLASKKFLLGLLIVGGSFSFPLPAYGDVQIPSVKMSGSSSLNLHLFRNKERNTDGGTGRGHRLAIESSKINFEAEGRAEEFDYGLKIEFSGQSNESFSVSENRLKIKGPWGTLYGGDTFGPENKSAYGGHRLMGATGGWDGKMSRTMVAATGSFIKSDMVGYTSTKTKLIYYTPRYSGFQFGLAFTPDGNHKGDAYLGTSSQGAKHGNPYGKNTVVTSLTYEKTFANDLMMMLSLTNLSGKGIPGDVNSTKVKDLCAWGIGGQTYWRGLSFGGEYMDGGRSYVNTSDFEGNNAGKKYNLAAGYTFGKHRVALGYYHFKLKNGRIKQSPQNTFSTLPSGSPLGSSTAEVVSVTYDRSIVPGLQVYGEANYYDTRTTANRLKAQTSLRTINSNYDKGFASNHGHSVIVGTKLSF